MEDTGRMPPQVPAIAKGDRAYKPYRVEFGKPNNVAVLERLNEERIKELRDRRNARPGSAHLAKSGDATIAPWAI